MAIPKTCVDCVGRSLCSEERETNKCKHFNKEQATSVARTVIKYLKTGEYLADEKKAWLYE